MSGSFGVGSEVTLTCGADGFPAPNFTWFLNGEQVQSESPQVPLLSFNVTPEDRGEYYCVADNFLGTNQSDSAFITINGTDVLYLSDLCTFDASPPLHPSS